jgi:hypothetical protein
LLFLAQGGARAAVAPPREPFRVPVVIVKFFPVKDGRIDREQTGNVDRPLEEVRAWTETIAKKVVYAMEEGSRYHGYKDPDAKPSLDYDILETYEFLEPTPSVAKKGHKSPMPDYHAIMKKIDGRKWVEDKGVKEVWVFSYHSDKIGLWESNMAGPWGDISNSDRDPDDLPVYDKTYTLYTYNYGRGPSEAMENHIHQIEHVLNYVDGRDTQPKDRWDELLFWGKFVGSDISHKIINPGCGWAHYPPNGESDYDWNNPRTVMSDIEDWKPDGSGAKKPISSEIWGGDSYRWFVYWMQAIPGRDNGLAYDGKPLNNWWIFIGDLDYAMTNELKLAGRAE